MCAIAGIIQNGAPVEFDELERMLALLAHRSPDGCGYYRDGRVGLAHGRLSLIDLEAGAQPISNADKTIWLAFNGEIFNYIELRRELQAKGHSFVTESDTEVILRAYEAYGERAWAMLNGQFAFALYDRRKRRVFLVRDRVGITPLHYAVADGAVVFASEAKALFASGRIEPRFSATGLAKVFSFWSAPAPDTVFEGVRQVRPGTALCIDEKLHVSEDAYWHPKFDTRLTAREASEELEARLRTAIGLRLRADVPVGAYLSGGLDSSVIVSMAQEAAPALETFSITFDDARFDESSEQVQVAQALRARRRELKCGSADIIGAMEDVIWHCETPLLRTSPAPMYLLSGLVQKAGIKTVLTGEGADELFAGYTIFKEDQIRRFWARQPHSKARPALLSRIHHYIGSAEARGNELWRQFFANGLSETEHPFYAHLVRWRNTSWTWRLLSPDIAGGASLEALMADLVRSMPDGWQDADPLMRAQVTEMHAFMSSYLLSAQGDRVAMAHGVEARFPFLDPDVIELALHLPKRDKLDGMNDKVCLRELASRRLPEAVWRRKKQPFRAPIAGALFSEAGRERFADYLSERRLNEQGLFNVTAVNALLRRLDKGAPMGEREEMGLVGVLSLSVLTHQLREEFGVRLAEGRKQIKNIRRHVLVDQTSMGAAL